MQMFGEEAAEDRSTDTGRHPYAAEIGLVLAALARSHNVRNHGLHDRQNAAAAEPLQAARQDQHRHVRRHGAQDRARDEQARYIEAAVNGVLIASLYLPNGNPQPGPKFHYKMAWFERLIGHASALMAAGIPVVLAGDYNVVPAAQDIYPTRSLDHNALVQPESRQAFARLVAQGWTDALRRLQPEGPLWTYWDYERNRWQSDKGMRLDHVLLSPGMSERLIDGGVDRWVRGEENASDHAPAWVTLDF